jgi:hypothetical protein
VHSQDDKSERFRALTDSFLASPLFYSDPDSDHHYALILMMTLLGDCPTQSEYGEEEKCGKYCICHSLTCCLVCFVEQLAYPTMALLC